MTQKVNCSVTGGTWNWPLNDNDLPDIPLWNPCRGSLITCHSIDGAYKAQVGYANNTTFVAWADSSNEHIGTLSEDGTWKSWTISGNSDFYGIAGLDANRCLLVYEDRFYVINTSTPTVEYEYAVWSAAAGWITDACIDCWDYVLLPLNHPGDTWYGMFMMVPKSYDGTDEYFCAGLLKYTAYKENKLVAVGRNSALIAMEYDDEYKSLGLIDYSGKTLTSYTAGDTDGSYILISDDIGQITGSTIISADVSFADDPQIRKTNLLTGKTFLQQTNVLEDYIAGGRIFYYSLFDRVIIPFNEEFCNCFRFGRGDFKTMSPASDYYLDSAFLSEVDERLIISWQWEDNDKSVITVLSGMTEAVATSSCIGFDIEYGTTSIETISNPNKLHTTNTYTVSGSLASPSTSKPLSFSSD